jgi:chaperonin GroEL (HSP60 family)
VLLLERSKTLSSFQVVVRFFLVFLFFFFFFSFSFSFSFYPSNISTGACETEAAEHLQKLATTQKTKQKFVLDAFAAALLFLPRTLLANAGFDPVDRLAELQRVHGAAQVSTAQASNDTAHVSSKNVQVSNDNAEISNTSAQVSNPQVSNSQISNEQDTQVPDTQASNPASNFWYGVDLETGTLADMMEMGVLEPCGVKVSALSLAVEAACTLIKAYGYT